MKVSFFNMVCIAISMVLAQTTHAVTTFPAVGVYDAEKQENAVDKSASYDPDHSTGVGKNFKLILDVDDLSPLIMEAYTNRHGGVVNFDNGLIEAGNQTDSFAAIFSGKAVLFQSIDHIRSDYVSSSRTPISGPGNAPNGGFLAKSTVRGDACTIGGSYQLTLTEYGFEAGEHVRVLTGTILGRNSSDKNGQWIMKTTLDNGDIIAASSVLDIASGNTSDDTFFGVYAPSGRYITGVSWTSYSGEFSGLDDVAIITSTSNFALPKIEVAAKPTPPVTQTTRTTAADDDSDEPPNGGFSMLFGVERPGR